MKNKNGYTVIELVIVIAIVSVFSFVAINKASYAFSDKGSNDAVLKEQQTELIEKAAQKYGEAHSEIFEESDTTYIRVSDLISEDYLLNNVINNFDKSQKIKLTFRDDSVRAKLEG